MLALASWQDKRGGLKTGSIIDVTDLLGPAGEILDHHHKPETELAPSFDNEGV